MESDNLLRSSRIAALEGALSILGLGDATNRVQGEELVVTLVKAGLAKKPLDLSFVTSGAA